MKTSILVVDDDPNIVRMLELGLKDEYDVLPVTEPSQAISVFSDHAVDLVISDIMMPGISGFDILRSVKAANPLVEVILLTGELPDKARPAVNAIHGGAHDYLLKPVRLRELKSAIFKALQKQRQSIEDRQKLQELIRQANTDFLTGLSNRHHFESQMNLEFERSERYARSLSCVILDIDDFKKINDQFGHYAGDVVLKRLGTLLTQHFRSSDLKCRYGGEEFLLVLPEADAEAAWVVAEKVRRFVAKEEFSFAGTPLQVTVSIGTATAGSHNFESAAQLIHAADLAMLEAKRSGRNCVRSFGMDGLSASRSEVTLSR